MTGPGALLCGVLLFVRMESRTGEPRGNLSLCARNLSLIQ